MTAPDKPPAAEPASAGAWWESDEECAKFVMQRWGTNTSAIWIRRGTLLVRAAAERAAREEREACVALLEAASLGIAASGTPAFPLAAGMLQQMKNAILARGRKP